MKKTFERKREGTLSTFPFPLSTGFCGMRRRSHGFTLIEMLVVIVIIVILMGVVFKLSRGAMAKSDYAKEEKLVTLVRTLIEEFHAEYNIYPPVPVYETHVGGCSKCAQKGKQCPAKYQQVINFRGVCPDGKGTRDELRHYPDHWSYAKINGKNCYFIFGLMSFFVNRAGYGQTAFNVNGPSGEKEVGDQWGAENDAVQGGGTITMSQKDKAFAHRVMPIVAELCGGTVDKPNLHQTYAIDSGYCLGFTTGVFGTFVHDGIGERRVDDEIERCYNEGLVYISKPPYTTYLLFSKGPDNDFDHDHPEDRTRPKNKDNIYGNLGDK